MNDSDSEDGADFIVTYSLPQQLNEGDTEVFEANNNDPNNNCEDIQFIEELAENEINNTEQSLDIPTMNYRTEIISPQPGCSKDLTNSTSHDLHCDTRLIHNLLPKLGYSAIYNNLLQNRYAINRIELALWDLLPNKRPEPQYACKRKYEHNVNAMTDKKFCNGAKQFYIFKDKQEVLSNNNCLNRDENLIHKPINDVLSSDKAYSTSNATVKRNGIIQPPKLILDKVITTSAITCHSVKRPILAPSKFKYTWYKKSKSSNNKMESFSNSHDNIQSTSANNVSFNIIGMRETMKEENVSNDNTEKDIIAVTEKSVPSYKDIPTLTNIGEQSVQVNKNCSSTQDFNKFDNTHNNDTAENVIIVDSSDSDIDTEEEERTKNSPENKFASSEKSNIFVQLTSMFPHIDPDYIQTICKDLHIVNQGILKKDNDHKVLYKLIDHLLTHGKNYPAKLNIKTADEEVNTSLNEQYTNLLGIFPNADPSYLREIAEKLYNNPDGLREFVQSKLELHDYPTREQYIAKRKITEQQKQYTTDFNVEEFLQIFPDPIHYFEDSKRKAVFKPVAFEFLKYWCPKHKVNTLMIAFASCKYQLASTVKVLESAPFDMAKERRAKILPTEDIPLLQEIAFITHKTEIITYLNNVKEKEAVIFKELKDKGELLKCECCFDDECVPSKCSCCENNHTFCHSCIRSGTMSKIGDGETSVQCFLNCGAEFSLSVLQRVLPRTQFSILLQKRQEVEVMAAGLDGLVSCPFCHFASIPPPEDKIFKCFNPECMKETCRLCKKPNHLPLKCNDTADENARHILEEKMTAALLRTCYSCKKSFFKEEGCNKMTCPCGAMMCYVCDQPVYDYSHFGGAWPLVKGCPLWSDNDNINIQPMVDIAQFFGQGIQERYPNIALNAGAFLP